MVLTVLLCCMVHPIYLACNWINFDFHKETTYEWVTIYIPAVVVVSWYSLPLSWRNVVVWETYRKGDEGESSSDPAEISSFSLPSIHLIHWVWVEPGGPSFLPVGNKTERERERIQKEPNETKKTYTWMLEETTCWKPSKSEFNLIYISH